MIEWWPLDKLLNAQELRGELYSYQIMSILLALENLSGKNDYGIGLYHGWINSRKKRDPFESTINLSILARSFEINGFSEKFPLAIDPTDNLLNGEVTLTLMIELKLIKLIIMCLKQNIHGRAFGKVS